MIFHSSVEPYARPAGNVGVRQSLAKRNVWDLPGNTVLWKAVGRFALVVCAITFVLNLFLGMYAGRLVTALSAVEGERHQLMDRNISLRAERAAMLSPAAIEAAAGKALSLYEPEGRHYLYNRRTGRFERL